MATLGRKEKGLKGKWRGKKIGVMRKKIGAKLEVTELKQAWR